MNITIHELYNRLTELLANRPDCAVAPIAVEVEVVGETTIRVLEATVVDAYVTRPSGSHARLTLFAGPVPALVP